MWSLNVEAKTCLEQLEDFYKLENPVRKARIMKFEGVDGHDVYNPTVPFECCGMTVIGGRVENRNDEISKTMFFRKNGDVWELIKDAPVLNLQDPFMTTIDGEIVVGGVYVEWDWPRLITYRTDFYKGKDIFNLKLFLSGPEFMKDVRLLELNDGRIAVFSRPQGQKMIEKYGCIAKIGFTICDKLEDVTEEVIDNAPHLDGQFVPSEWGGANQLHVLENGAIGVIAHKSYHDGAPDDMKIHYHGIAFAIKPDTRELTQCKIISNRKSFPMGPQKNSRAWDVTFTSGIIRNANGKAMLYTGLSDCECGEAEIDDPFIEYEK